MEREGYKGQGAKTLVMLLPFLEGSLRGGLGPFGLGDRDCVIQSRSYLC